MGKALASSTVVLAARHLFLLAALIMGSPALAWRGYAAGREGIPFEHVVKLLHSPQGSALASELVHRARESQRRGTLSRFQAAILRAAQGLKSLDRHRGQIARPDSSRNWQRWNRIALRQRGPAAVLNTLAEALVENREAQVPVPVPGDERRVSYLDRQALERGLGADAVEFVDKLNRSNEGRQPDVRGVNWWTAQNGLSPKAAAAASDKGSLSPYMPGLRWAVQRFGKLQGLKGALIRWPLRGNTLALLGETGIPLHNTVAWTDKDHFTDPRVPTAAAKLDPGLRLRGIGIERDRAFIDRWVRDNLARLTPEELRSARPLFLISDDGGLLNKQVAAVMQQPDLNPYRHLFAGAEQTGRGSNLLAKADLPFRVINMARSETKAFSGSMMWGYAIVSQAVRNVLRLRANGVTIGKRAAVIGAGPIGRAAASWLRQAGFTSVELWDADPQKRHELRLRDDKLQVLADADLVISCSAGNRTLGREVLHEYARRGFAPKTQVWVNGGSPGEHGRLDGRELRPEGLQTDRRGVLSALWNGKRIPIGQRTAGPDLDRLAQYKGWSVFDLRDGRVINGQSDLDGVRRGLFENTGALYYGQLPLDPRRNDPVPGYAVQLELSMMHIAHLHALGQTDERGEAPHAGIKNLVTLPSGEGSRQQSLIGAMFRYGTHLMIAQETRGRTTLIAW